MLQLEHSPQVCGWGGVAESQAGSYSACGGNVNYCVQTRTLYQLGEGGFLPLSRCLKPLQQQDGEGHCLLPCLSSSSHQAQPCRCLTLLGGREAFLSLLMSTMTRVFSACLSPLEKDQVRPSEATSLRATESLSGSVGILGHMTL